MKQKNYFLLVILLLPFLSSNIMATNRISLNVKNIPTPKILRWLAQSNHQNIIVSPDINSKITVHLRSVSAKDALLSILNATGLFHKKIGNILYIAPLEEIKQYSEKQQFVTNQSPLKTQFIHLNYAKATNMVKILGDKNQKLLSKIGSISADDRTNSLLIKDHEGQLNQIIPFIKKLDKAVPQVAIQARIVNIDYDYEKELGLRFGITSGRHLSGTLKGANKIAEGKNIASVNPADRLNVDLPSLAAHSASIGLALFRLAQGTLLDLELSALESEGKAKIISTPRLLTANRQTASIQSGEEIPYQESAGTQGTTKTSFKKALLSLKVTPQITPDHRLILDLQVNQDKRGNQEVKGVPTIDTREIKTQVLVNNHQTIVLGGIYEHTKINGVERVPFFSSLPLIGKLFRHKKVVDNRRELLIFITPNIMDNATEG